MKIMHTFSIGYFSEGCEWLVIGFQLACKWQWKYLNEMLKGN